MKSRRSLEIRHARQERLIIADTELAISQRSILSMSTVDFDFPQQSSVNELANVITHGVGLLLSIAGAISLILAGLSSGYTVMFGLAIYGFTLTLVYVCSVLSHAVRDPSSKLVLRAWDQGSIYLLIAGTHTPFIIQYLPTGMNYALLGGVWTAALIGCYSKIATHHRVNSLSMWSYLALGWLPFMCSANHLPQELLSWVIAGGALFSLGAVFLKFDQRVNYFHAIWHVFVMLGTGAHFYAVYQYAI